MLLSASDSLTYRHKNTNDAIDEKSTDIGHSRYDLDLVTGKASFAEQSGRVARRSSGTSGSEPRPTG